MFAKLPPIRQIAADLRGQRYSVRDLVDYCLARIDQFETRARAWVSVNSDAARLDAERMGRELAAGRDRGLLHGIPLGIKDLIDIDGWPTRAGSPLRADHVATRDAPVITQLRAAGAILLGKTVTTEWACFDPPVTRNPWHPERTPGGSSSGSAVGVSLGMCVAALGSQTGGSIIRPASFCGVAGLKPTFGRVSTEGVVPLTDHLDHVGPIGRSVDDLRIVFNAIVGRPNAGATPANGAESSLSEVSFLTFDGYFDEQADEEVRRVTAAALDRLRAGGVSFQRAELPPSFADVHRHHRRVMTVEAAAYYGALYQQRSDAFGPKVASLLRDGLDTSDTDYQQSRTHQQQFQREMTQLLPGNRIALMPSTSTPAPDAETTGDPKFNSPWSYAGLPTVTIPCGLSGDGLPCGLQLLGGAGEESTLLMAAEHCEKLLGFHSQPAWLA